MCIVFGSRKTKKMDCHNVGNDLTAHVSYLHLCFHVFFILFICFEDDKTNKEYIYTYICIHNTNDSQIPFINVPSLNVIVGSSPKPSPKGGKVKCIVTILIAHNRIRSILKQENKSNTSKWFHQLIRQDFAYISII